MTVMVFYARAYNFQGRDGRQVSGNEVHYLEPMTPAKEGNEVGLRPLVVSADAPALDALLGYQLPALVEVEMTRRPGAKGKPETVIERARPMHRVEVDSFFKAPSSTPAKA